MPIMNYTTAVSPIKSAGEVQTILARHGATLVSTLYVAGNPVGIAFSINTQFGRRNFELPANADGVYRTLVRTAERRYRTREHSQRVAWRILKDWVEAQIAVIESGMVTLDEVMLPYMITDNGRTLTETYRNSEQMRSQIGGASSPKELEA
jgi:hypothetical protein